MAGDVRIRASGITQQRLAHADGKKLSRFNAELKNGGNDKKQAADTPAAPVAQTPAQQGSTQVGCFNWGMNSVFLPLLRSADALGAPKTPETITSDPALAQLANPYLPLRNIIGKNQDIKIAFAKTGYKTPHGYIASANSSPAFEALITNTFQKTDDAIRSNFSYKDSNGIPYTPDKADIVIALVPQKDLPENSYAGGDGEKYGIPTTKKAEVVFSAENFNADYIQAHLSEYQDGSPAILAIGHELQHALGLSGHPHNGDIQTLPAHCYAEGFPGVFGMFDPGDIKGTSAGFDQLNQSAYTIATYNHGWHSSNLPNAPVGGLNNVFPSTPMSLDMMALQAMYGAEIDTRIGDDVYWMHKSGDLPKLQTLYDNRGDDTIAYDGDGNYRIDLRQTWVDGINGHLSDITGINPKGGDASFVEDVPDAMWIYRGVDIENAYVKTAHLNVGNIIGNPLNNQITLISTDTTTAPQTIRTNDGNDTIRLTPNITGTIKDYNYRSDAMQFIIDHDRNHTPKAFYMFTTRTNPNGTTDLIVETQGDGWGKITFENINPTDIEAIKNDLTFVKYSDVKHHTR